MIYSYKDKHPIIAETAYIADFVTITGDVKIGEYSSIWFNTVIRGDVDFTVIGDRVNIQDNCVLHQSPNCPVIIEDDVTIGHQVLIHGATIRKGSLIGMGSIILDGADIGEGALIGAGSLVVQGTIIPPNTLAFGRPAKPVRELNDEDKQELERIVTSYVLKGQSYRLLNKG